MPSYGYQGQFGMKEEAAWGTFVAPDHFSEYVSEGLRADEDRLVSPGIRGLRSRYKQQVAQGVKRPGGPVTFDLWAKGLGLLFKHTLGAVTTTVPGGGTNSRLHTFDIADTLPTGLSLEVGRVAQVHRYTGSRVNRLSFACRAAEIPRLTFDLLCRDEQLTASPTAATFPAANELLVFHQGIFKIDTVATEIYEINFIIDNALRAADFRLGARTRGTLDAMDRIVGGSFRLPYDATGVTQYNKFRNLTAGALDLKFTGSLIEGALNYYLQVLMPVVFYDGETPTTPGREDEIPLSIPFRAWRDTSTEVQILYQNTETAP